MDHRHSEAGVTLLEILIVLVIVAAMAGMVAVATGGAGPESSLVRASDLMAARLTLVAERAALTGEDAAISWDADGYRFLQFRDGAWRPYAVQAMAGPERLGAIRLADPARPAGVVLTADPAEPDTYPLRWVLERGSDRMAVVFDGLTARTEPVQ